ncbi:glycosyltransferase family 1 protein [Blastococcus sp. CT_GayMR20]|uniref:glycosyltransferase family 4 protein n=1 Tax=Blastococcus sp. CT_GayMR20 TaxID=2559609 RepID=UPI00107389F1|nr:glycosyltransferase family 1 protein [Blastococcus sp. CT_GayMR20]TFV85693.1 glycosyltransferase family 1 protein [Blastococcus sp. CT_GayMR20]
MSVDEVLRTDVPSAADLLDALHQRLGVTAATLGLDTGTRSGDPAGATSELYGRLVEHVHAATGPEALWLLMTAMCGAMPHPDEVRAALRSRDVNRPADFGRWLLEAVYASSAARGASDVEMDVVAGGVVVDVDFTARHELHTGIQRVVRETVPRWQRAHDLTLVAWTDAGGAMRQLTMFELDRVLRWNDLARQDRKERRARRRDRLVVPWHASVLLPENPAPDHCAALTALSLYSGSTVGLIGYDCIPLISPELIHEGLPDRFMRYLEPVKHARRVVGISAAATREFRGFVSMLSAQGLEGPTVVECSLPVEVPAGDDVAPTDPPLVVTIGSFEPRKNQLTVLHAAEQLWRDGLEFQLEFIGGGGWPTEFDALMARLRKAGRPVRRRTAVTDEELWRTLRSARFSVFLSLHEGFGLPVAESLACGTPCLTSDYGSTREIADGGGALVADPHDDLAIAEQMRRLLVDDGLLAHLKQQALERPRRTWDDYADELWTALAPVPPGTGEAPR